MKIMKSIYAITFVGLIFMSIGCKKKETKPSTPSIASSATISGTVKAETDNTNVNSEVQANIKIVATYNKMDLVLNPVAGQTYPVVSVTAFTDATGKYTLSIPTNGKPVDVTLKPQDFISNVVTSPNTNTPDQLFSSAPISITVVEKDAKIINISY